MANIYRIGVAIAVGGNGPAYLAALSRHILGVNANANQLAGTMGRLRLAVGGALAVAGGTAILATMGKMLTTSEALTKEQGKMRAAGLSQKEVAEATANAWRMSTTQAGAAVAENLAAISHLRAALGSLHEAQMVAPAYQRNATALQAITGKPGEAQAFQMAQAIHLSGAANDPITHKLNAAAFARQMNLYTAMVAAGGGKMNADMLLLFQKQAGSFGTQLSESGRINLVGAIQAMGGDRSGTALTASNRALIAGIMPKKVMQAYADMGLLDPSKIRAASGKGAIGSADSGAVAGGNVVLAKGALKNEQQFIQDPMGWVWGTLRPLLISKGLTTAKTQIDWVNKSGINIRTARFLAEGLANEGIDRQEAANVRKAAGVDQYTQVMSTDMTANKKALREAFHDMITAFASPLVPSAIGAMQGITRGVQAITAWAVKHPGAVRGIGITLAAVAVGLVVLGTAAVGIAAFALLATGGTVGLVVAGVAALLAALGTIVALNWDAIKGAGSSLSKFIQEVFSIGAYIMAHPIQAYTNKMTTGQYLPKDPKDLTKAEKTGKTLAWSLFHPLGALSKGGRLASGMAVDGLEKLAQWGPRNPGLAPYNTAAVQPPKPANQNDRQPIIVNMDGKKVAEIVAAHMADQMGAQRQAGRFDPRVGLPNPGASYRQ